MEIGIVCAAEKELAPFLPQIEDIKVSEKTMLRFYEGRIGGTEVVAVVSGVCKVNAAIAAQILIDRFGVTAVINSGTAGGMDAKLRIYDTVVATECCYHDVAENILTEYHPHMETVFFESSPHLLRLSQKAVENLGLRNVYYGRMVTGEAFITDEGRGKIIENYAPLSVDMETAGIAHVCYVNGIPFLSIRCITDTAEHSGNETFHANCARASEVAANLTMEIINEIR